MQEHLVSEELVEYTMINHRKVDILKGIYHNMSARADRLVYQLNLSVCVYMVYIVTGA